MHGVFTELAMAPTEADAGGSSRRRPVPDRATELRGCVPWTKAAREPQLAGPRGPRFRSCAVARPDKAGLVSVDDCMHSVAQRELGQDPRRARQPPLPVHRRAAPL